MAESQHLINGTHPTIEFTPSPSRLQPGIEESGGPPSGNGSARESQEGHFSEKRQVLARSKGKATTRRTSALRHWIPEIVSFWISLSALVAIVAVVRTRHGKPLPEWRSPFTINFLVSVFTSILKAALMMPIAEALSELKWVWFADSRPLSNMDDFDSASRGPRGSLRFLFKLPRNGIACLGAFITILGLGIGPVTQLVVQTYDCLTEQPGSATISRTNSFKAQGMRLEGSSFEQTFALDRSMSSAIYQGLLSPPKNATSSILHDCPSGNCTFPSYSSLAICTSVIDISQQVIRRESTGPDETTYSLPSGLNLTSWFRFATAAVPSSAKTGNSPLFEFEALMENNDCGGRNSSETLCDRKPAAFRASLFPCIQTYGGVKISKFQLRQDVLSSTRLPLVRRANSAHYYQQGQYRSAGEYYFWAGDLPSLPGVDCSPATSLQGRKTQENTVRELNAGMSDTTTVEPLNALWYDPACTYEISEAPTKSIGDYLGQRFFGQSVKDRRTVADGVWAVVYQWARDYRLRRSLARITLCGCHGKHV